jgi:CIC family chloride channel protein
MRADHQVLHAPSFDYPINHELIFYVLLGLMCGLLAVFYIKSFYGIRDWFQRSRLPRSITPILGGLIVGVSLIFFPQVSASGYATMNEVFAGGLSVGLLLSLVLVKIAMTGVTLGCGGSGGVFAPAMFIGAVFGGGFASLVNMLIPGALGASGSFGLIGMGAFLAASTHAPMTAIFLLWEMTRDYNVVLPIMITAITATLVARRLMTDSIDSYDLSRRGLDIHAGAEANLLRGLYVRGLVSRDFQQIPESMAVTDFVRYVTNSHHVYFPVVNRDNELTGIISIQDLKTVLLHRDAWPFLIVGELAETDVLTVSASDNLYDAMQLITARGLEQVPVVDESDPKRVIGMLKRADLQNFYQKRLLARELHG